MRARARPSRHRGRGHWRAAADSRARRAYRPRSPAARPRRPGPPPPGFSRRGRRASRSSGFCSSPITKSRASPSVPDSWSLPMIRLISPPSMAPSALAALIIARRTSSAVLCSSVSSSGVCGSRKPSGASRATRRIRLRVAALLFRAEKARLPSRAISPPPTAPPIPWRPPRTAPARAASPPIASWFLSCSVFRTDRSAHPTSPPPAARDRRGRPACPTDHPGRRPARRLPPSRPPSKSPSGLPDCPSPRGPIACETRSGAEPLIPACIILPNESFASNMFPISSSSAKPRNAPPVASDPHCMRGAPVYRNMERQDRSR